MAFLPLCLWLYQSGRVCAIRNLPIVSLQNPAIVKKPDTSACLSRQIPSIANSASPRRHMLNQASTDRIELAKLLNISGLQMSYITNVGAGQGLIKVGSSLVPFINKFPRNTELYKLMTTKFGEV